MATDEGKERNKEIAESILDKVVKRFGGEKAAPSAIPGFARIVKKVFKK